MTAPDDPQVRWGMFLGEAVSNVQTGFWELSVLEALIAARLAVKPVEVQVTIAHHLGRPYLKIEVAV